MEDDEFEWDDAKARSNLAKHGVGFEAARRVFDDAFACSRIEPETNAYEFRHLVIGMVEGRVLCVAYTERGDRMRIISARKATKHEQREYHNSQSAE